MEITICLLLEYCSVLRMCSVKRLSMGGLVWPLALGDTGSAVQGSSLHSLTAIGSKLPRHYTLNGLLWPTKLSAHTRLSPRCTVPVIVIYVMYGYGRLVSCFWMKLTVDLDAFGRHA